MYYRLVDDLSYPDRWHLQAPIGRHGVPVDPRTFMGGMPVDVVGPLRMPMRVSGKPLSFTLADFDLPVVSPDVGTILERLVPLEIQRIPVSIDGSRDEYEILNVLRVVDCLDHNRSEVTYWTPNDVRPEKTGLPKMVINLTVDPKRIDGAGIFRIANWKVALIVSEQVAEALREYTGVQLQPAS